MTAFSHEASRTLSQLSPEARFPYLVVCLEEQFQQADRYGIHIETFNGRKAVVLGEYGLKGAGAPAPVPAPAPAPANVGNMYGFFPSPDRTLGNHLYAALQVHVAGGGRKEQLAAQQLLPPSLN